MQGNLFSRVDANNRKETEFDQIVANWGEVLSKRFLLSENLVQGGVESSISKPTS
jgi:regulator of sigma D